MRTSEIAVKRRPAAFMRGLVLSCLGAGSLALTGCLGLQVDNPNTLNVENVFNNASNVEASLVGGWKRYYGLVTGANTNNTASNCPTFLFAVWGNVMTTATTTYGEGSQEPRVPLDNTNNLQCANRGPWYDVYSAIASGREAYQAIVANKLTYGTVDATYPNGKDTPSRLIFAKFLIAIGQLNVGLRFDQAFITDINTPKGSAGGDLKPYKDVIANAITQLRAVQADAKAAETFTFPTSFINARTITRDEFVRIVEAYIIQAEVYAARTPAERDAVNWALVLAQLDSTITVNFAMQADPAVALTRSRDIDISISQTTARVNNRLLGPADTSGQYQLWVAAPLSTRNAITITTPDRRIHGAGGNTTVGTRFTYLTTTQSSATLAPYLTSKYRSNRYLTSTSDSGQKALVSIISLEELKFIKAEALYRLGRFTEAAAIINPTRIAAGLKAVDANGPPAGRDCVPRKDNGACGDLFDAIKYEKRIEIFPSVFDVPWFDERGWGRLVSGTPLHLPVSGRELISLGLPYYTIGGGGPGSAP